MLQFEQAARLEKACNIDDISLRWQHPKLRSRSPQPQACEIRQHRYTLISKTLHPIADNYIAPRRVYFRFHHVRFAVGVNNTNPTYLSCIEYRRICKYRFFVEPWLFLTQYRVIWYWRSMEIYKNFNTLFRKTGASIALPLQ